MNWRRARGQTKPIDGLAWLLIRRSAGGIVCNFNERSNVEDSRRHSNWVLNAVHSD